ncbi:hypothetical protein SEA_JINKIES_60 [Arthrobacter phage Jinkies]|uniref:Uncharacterized protein n=1 Tax=Arthrobacter phage Jinkies TaxID=2743903 RepID=A0A7T0IFJ1_9CAUD|nr:hypothetical protein SEA_JINKIES_60 [Arthrobacter phage Jinkies]
MTPNQRDQLLDLHRAAMNAQAAFVAGKDDGRLLDAADDKFRAFLFALPVSSHT